MNKTDFSRILQTVIDQCPDGEYDPVYLTLGFLASSLESDSVQSSLLKNYSESEIAKDRMNRLAYLLNDIMDIYVHGGLTFAARCHPEDPEDSGIYHIPGPGESDKVWWLGFDCAHAYDLMPGMNSRYNLACPDDVYRDIDYVRSQISILAAQLESTYC